MKPRLLVWAAVVLLAFFAARDLRRLGDDAPWRRMFDFVDFYCAGQALQLGADPYRYEPLHGCEHRHAGGLSIYRAPGLAVPAPLPPYDLAAYRLVARLPFPAARALDAFATVAALGISCAALAWAGIPAVLALLALALPIGYVELAAGEVAPFAFAALALCGAALAARRDAAAGFFAALVAIEPHVALPACVAVAAFAPRARAALVATLAGLALVALATAGRAGIVEYAASVLPMHAFAEAVNPQQYSLTYAAWFLGLSRSSALAAGNVLYVLVSLLGIYLAGAKRSASGTERSLLAFVPAASSIAGASFMHAEELVFAIPAALVFAARRSGATQVVAAAALCLLTVPWLAAWPIKRLFAVSILICLLLLVRLRLRAWPALAIAAPIGAVLYAFELAPRTLHIAPPALRYAAGALAQREWIGVMDAIQTHDPLWFAIKLPVWAALAALLALAARDAAAPATHCEAAAS